jgi:hypothetical protein
MAFVMNLSAGKGGAGKRNDRKSEELSPDYKQLMNWHKGLARWKKDERRPHSIYHYSFKKFQAKITCYSTENDSRDLIFIIHAFPFIDSIFPGCS